MIKSILWDVDGALFDTYPAVTYSFSKALNEMGFSIALNVIDGLVRRALDDCVDTLCGRFKLDPDLLSRKFIEAYRAMSPAGQPPFPGVRDVATWIHQIGGLNVIVTYLGAQSTRRLLQAHHLSHLFDGIVIGSQGFPQKTDSAVIVAALEKYSMDPTSTLLIGDRPMSIQAGKSVGVRTCLYRKAEATVAADIQIDNYGQLLDLLASEVEKR